MLMGDLLSLNRNERGVNWVMRTERACGRRTGEERKEGKHGPECKTNYLIKKEIHLYVSTNITKWIFENAFSITFQIIL